MSRVGAAVLGGLALAPAFVAPSTQTLRGSGVSQGRATPSGPSSPSGPGAATLLGTAAVACYVAGSRKATVACAFDPSTQVGATAPLGFFDPAGFCRDIDEEGFKKLRAAEIKHARGAMMGALGLLVQSVYKFPGYESVPSGLAAQWTEPGSNSLWLLFGAIGCLELGLGPWKEDPEKPGDYGDPLNLAKGEVSDDIRNRELNNGRFAMFAFLGIVSAELYTGSSAISQFAMGAPRAARGGSAFCGASSAPKPSATTRRAFDGAAQPGAVAPLGFFDPLGLSGSQERFDKFRAQELKHGRVAMMAILGAFAGHWATPVGAPAGIDGFQDPMGAKGCVALVFACAFLEVGPWSDAFAKAPGDFGDPCDFATTFDLTDDEKMKEMKTKELSNGRLAMMATIGMCVQESVFGDKFSDLPAQLGL